MEKYLKMSGHFVGKVSINTDGQICDDKYFRGSTDIAEDYYVPICHAINSHDELVENMQQYKQEAEQWEVRATKEASKAQDLEAEVERLRDAMQDAYLDGCHAGWDMSGEGYNAEYGGPEDGAMHDMFVTMSIEYMK